MSDHSSLTWDQAVSAVGAEQAAMTIMGTWAIGAFTKGSNWEPGVDFGKSTTHDPGTHPAVPPRHLRLHGRSPIPKSARAGWMSSPRLSCRSRLMSPRAARTDIDPMEFPDPIRQEMQQFLSENPES